MSERKAINENELDKVVGGLFWWDKSSMTLTYNHDDGSTTYHEILNYDAAWELSNQLHAQNYREDTILNKLKRKGYIA